MKKTLFFAMGLVSTITTSAQDYSGRVGINTQTPKATMDIVGKPITDEDKTHPRGVLFPKYTNAERSQFTNVETGTMIFNTDNNCLEIFDGTDWKCNNSTKITHTHIWGWNGVKQSQDFMNAPWMRLSPGLVASDGNSFVNYDGSTLPPDSDVLFISWKKAFYRFNGGVNIGGMTYRIPTFEEWQTIMPCFLMGTTTVEFSYEDNMLGKHLVTYKTVQDNRGHKHTYAIRFRNNPNLHSAWRWKYKYEIGYEITIVPPTVMNNLASMDMTQITSDTFFDEKLANNEAFKMYIPVSDNTGHLVRWPVAQQRLLGNSQGQMNFNSATGSIDSRCWAQSDNWENYWWEQGIPLFLIAN